MLGDSQQNHRNGDNPITDIGYFHQRRIVSCKAKGMFWYWDNIDELYHLYEQYSTQFKLPYDSGSKGHYLYILEYA
jgi:hypothetical protein